jgi:hypothetical protein
VVHYLVKDHQLVVQISRMTGLQPKDLLCPLSKSGFNDDEFEGFMKRAWYQRVFG